MSPGDSEPVDRRRFVRLGATASITAALAACTGDDSDGSSGGADRDRADGDGAGRTERADTTDSTAAGSTVPKAIAESELPVRGEAPVRVIIDSDAANEIDDQFALAWALLAPERIRIEGITAAPFSFADYLADLHEVQARRSDGPVTKFEELAVSMGPEGIDDLRSAGGPAQGMRESLAEISAVLDAAAPASRPPAIAGAEEFMADVDTPVDSDAATAIIEAARAEDTPLYVPVLGAATNVASALLLDPDIAHNVVVVFVAGWPSGSPHIDESFNIIGDRAASTVLFTRAPKLLYLPGYGVAETLTVSKPEVDDYVRGRGALGDLLASRMDSMVAPDGNAEPGNRRVMWDMAPIAWLIDPQWVPTFRTSRGVLGEDDRWEPAPGEMTEAYSVDDVKVFTDFFARLESHPAGG